MQVWCDSNYDERRASIDASLQRASKEYDSFHRGMPAAKPLGRMSLGRMSARGSLSLRRSSFGNGTVSSGHINRPPRARGVLGTLMQRVKHGVKGSIDEAPDAEQMVQRSEWSSKPSLRPSDVAECSGSVAEGSFSLPAANEG
jgi:hypothetical protein